MKKSWILFVMLAMFGLSSFSQLRVANNFGKDLYVGVNGKEEFIPNKGVKTFASVRVRTVFLDCRSADGVSKFTVSKEVSRSGLAEISSNDDSRTTTVVANQVTYSVTPAMSPTTTTTVITTPERSGSSLNDLLTNGNSSSTTEVTYTQPKSTVVTKSVTTSSTPVVNYQVAVVNQPVVVAGEAINFVYTGSSRFKIFSEIGRGLEFLGTDSINKADNAKNQYTIYIQKNQDLIIGIGLKTGADQAIWPYAEIRKRVNSGDVNCYITQKDIKKMSTSENKKLRIHLLAEKYKIFFEPDSGDPISIGYREVSRAIEVPIGQFYIRVSYTDPNGMFHKTVFVPKHVTGNDQYLDITKNDLDNAVQLNW